MSPELLTASSPPQTDSISLHDRIQIALAIADQGALQSILVDCTPPILPPQRLGQLTAKIGVPIGSQQAADGIIEIGVIDCVPADTRDTWTTQPLDPRQPDYAKLTRCESKLHTLGQNLSQAQAIALLTQIGWSSYQIETILALPHQAWHKSWWYTLDAIGDVKIPFLRLLRTRRYSDGTFTLQYKDQYAQEQPSCVWGRTQKVLVEISNEGDKFKQILEKINRARSQLDIEQVVLVCDRLSVMEAKGFISQNISIYAAEKLVFPTQADCALCATIGCPMQGLEQSPVLTCDRFCLDTTLNRDP